jgi:hypothetical protein
MNDNKNDKHGDANQQGILSPNGDPVLAGRLPSDNNGHATKEPDGEREEVAGEASEKRTVSSRKIEANQRNSRESTGPKTAAGKKRVSKNAIRHGFYSKWLLVDHQDGAETYREYSDWHAAIRKYYQPIDWLEEFRVEEIAILSWRRRRLLRSESGLIAKALAEHSYNLQASKASDIQEPEAITSGRP